MAHETITWRDPANTGAEGWLVIDRLINGVSGGGLFMAEDASLAQVTDLAKVMSLKNQLNDFPFGGAKAGIKFNPHACEKREVMERFLLYVKDQLNTTWSTGADVNTTNTEINTVCTKILGLSSPFYSLGKKMAEFYGIKNQSKDIFKKTNLLVDDLFPIADYATALVVAESIHSIFKRKNIKPKVLIYGFGKIGRCLFYLLQKISHIIGIADNTGFVLLNKNTDYLPENNIDHNMTLKQMAEQLNCQFYQETNNAILLEQFLSASGPVDIFCPCAHNNCINPNVINALSNYTFPENKEGIMLGSLNSYFSDNVSKEQFEKTSIKLYPSWLTSCGASLIYAHALSYDGIDGWKESALNYVSRKLDTFLLK